MPQKFVIMLCASFIALSFPFRGEAFTAKAETVETAADKCNGTVTECIKQTNQTKETPKAENTKAASQKTDKTKKEDVPFTSGTSTFATFFKVILSLVFVLAIVIYLLRYVNKKTRSFQDLKVIQNLGGVSVGTNRSVQLIKTGDQILVVGVGENVQLLKEITNEEEVQKMIAKAKTSNTNEEPFSKMVQSFKRSSSEKASFGEFLSNQLHAVKEERKTMVKNAKEKGKEQ